MLARQNMVQSFDAARITGSPQRIPLTLEIEYQGESDIEGEAYSGKMRFGFQIPFYPGLVMDEAQTVSAHEVDLTLESWVVAPSMTRARFCMRSETVNFTDYEIPQLLVSVNGQQIATEKVTTRSDMVAIPADLPGNCRIAVIPQALDALPGDWTVTIEKLVSTTPSPPDVLQAALTDAGLTSVTIQDDGSLSINGPDTEPGQSVESLIDEVVELAYSLRESWDGPWTFAFNLPG
jgi:hypothetical protein